MLVFSICSCLWVYLNCLVVLWLSVVIEICMDVGSSGLLCWISGLDSVGLVGFMCFLCMLLGMVVVSSMVFFFICLVWDLVLLMWVVVIGCVCRKFGIE